MSRAVGAVVVRLVFGVVRATVIRPALVWETCRVVALKQPEAGFVTVTEYVPAVFTTNKLPACETGVGPPKLYKSPPPPPPPVRVSEVWAQVSIAFGLAVSADVIATVLLVMVAVCVAVQPLAPVTVTVNVLAWLTVAELPDEATMPVPANAHIPPPKAVSVTVVRIQLSVLLLTASPSVGAVVLLPTETLAVRLQPFWSVAVTKYTPDILTASELLIILPVQRRAVADEVDVSVRLIWAQVSVPLVGDILSIGNDVSVLTVEAVCPVALTTVSV